MVSVTLDRRQAGAREWARIQAEATAAGRPMATQDGWIAATARFFGLPLVTHDHADFRQVAGIRVLTLGS